MLDSVSSLFGPKIDHPLADAKEFKRALATLPIDNAFKALDEVTGWIESLQLAQDFPEDLLFDIVCQFEEAAAPHVRRLVRDYLLSPRLSRTEEKRLWTMMHGYWTQIAASYERCLSRAAQPKDKVAARLQPALPALSVRLIAALALVVKWEQFRYGPTRNAIWSKMGEIYLAAEAGKYSGKPVKRYSNSRAPTSVSAEYLKVLVFQASSMDSLLPAEIELAQKLIAYFLPGFVFSAGGIEEAVYWVDPATDKPPQRLACMPSPASTLRFFQPGTASAAVSALMHDLERGLDLPADIELGAQYQPRALLPVLHHLTESWAKVPPQRKHQRHHVKNRAAVLNGLVNSFVVFSRGSDARSVDLPIESWVVEDVSRGGFGAVVSDIRSDWLRVGALVAVQPEGGNNWLLGIVRRYSRQSENEARAGIESLSRTVAAVELKPRTASSYAAVNNIPGLWLLDGSEPGEARLLLPPSTFDMRESLEFDSDGKRHLLTPLAMTESTSDYELARYSLLIAE